jgi:putative nucleotidyltransferase with HDIG domain
VNKALREKIEAYIKNMPSLPATRPKVLEVCNNPRISPAELKQVISLDPVLVGRTLKLVNSAYGGMEGRPVNMVRAITMLGINTVKNLVLSAALMDNFDSGESRQFDHEGYWQHSLCVAVAAKLIARKRGIDPELLEEYFAAGLLHDIGKIPLSAALPRDYPSVLKASGSRRIPLFLGESETLGLNHNEAGELVAEAWKIEGALAEAAIHHHDYPEYPGKRQDLLYSIVAANYFASVTGMGFSGSRRPQKPEGTVWKTLGIAWEDVEKLKGAVDKAMKQARIFLGL